MGGTAGSNVPPVPEPVEPGYTTTEFWGKNTIQLISLLMVFNIAHFTSSQEQALIGAGGLFLPEIAYAISRAIRKRGR